MSIFDRLFGRGASKAGSSPVAIGTLSPAAPPTAATEATAPSPREDPARPPPLRSVVIEKTLQSIVQAGVPFLLPDESDWASWDAAAQQFFPRAMSQVRGISCRLCGRPACGYRGLAVLEGENNKTVSVTGVCFFCATGMSREEISVALSRSPLPVAKRPRLLQHARNSLMMIPQREGQLGPPVRVGLTFDERHPLAPLLQTQPKASVGSEQWTAVTWDGSWQRGDSLTRALAGDVLLAADSQLVCSSCQGAVGEDAVALLRTVAKSRDEDLKMCCYCKACAVKLTLG